MKTLRHERGKVCAESCTLPGGPQAVPEEEGSSRSGLLVQPEVTLRSRLSRRKLLRAGLAAAPGLDVPIALGGGRTVFGMEQRLTLQHSRTFKNGRVVVTYAA